MQEVQQIISPIKQRILSFVDTLGVSKREFYAEVGISRGTLESKTGITEDVLTKFIARYPDVSIEWLIHGRGPMLKTPLISEGKANDQSPGRERIFTVCDPIEKYNYEAIIASKGIPLIPVSAVAGFFAGDTCVLNDDCTYYNVPVFHGADFLISVRGESMIPSYLPGDIVACKLINNESYIQWGRVYVIDTDQGPIIKRIKPLNKGDSLLIASDNPDFAPFELRKDSIRSMALVLGFLRPD